jgi:hypothetical protein
MAVIINGNNTPTAGAVAVGDGTTLAFTAAGTSGQVLTSNGAGVPTWTTNGAGTVTSASVVSANGFAGTVANASTTPEITLTTSITGVIKGNGTAMSAAVAGTDYVTPTGTETLTNKTLTNPTVTNYVETLNAIGTVTSSSTLSLTGGTVQTATLTASTACTFTMPTATAVNRLCYCLNKRHLLAMELQHLQALNGEHQAHQQLRRRRAKWTF